MGNEALHEIPQAEIVASQARQVCVAGVLCDRDAHAPITRVCGEQITTFLLPLDAQTQYDVTQRAQVLLRQHELELPCQPGASWDVEPLVGHGVDGTSMAFPDDVTWQVSLGEERDS